MRRMLIGLGLALFVAGPSAAQSDPRLAGAVRLAQDGLSDSARAVVGRLLAATQPTDSLYPEVLYTMGFLAGTEADRRLYLRRVVVDYSQSVWADDALLQLAQLEYASGNTEAAVRQLDQLLRDYPSSSLTATAALWGARAAGDRRDASTACRMAETGLAAVAGDVELRNQLEFQKQRCQGLAAIAADSARIAVADSATRANAATAPRPRPVASTPKTTGQSPRAGFYVQVSAVKTQAAATAEIARIKRAGFTAVSVRESGLLKIRAGAYRTRAEADAVAGQIRGKLGGRPFVVRVP